MGGLFFSAELLCYIETLYNCRGSELIFFGVKYSPAVSATQMLQYFVGVGELESDFDYPLCLFILKEVKKAGEWREWWRVGLLKISDSCLGNVF